MLVMINRGIDSIQWCIEQNMPTNREANTTEWFDGTTQPTREGWYDRSFTDGVFRQYWNGVEWCFDRYLQQPHWHQVGAYPCWRGRTTRWVDDPEFIGWSNKGETCTVLYDGKYYSYKLIEIQTAKEVCRL